MTKSNLCWTIAAYDDVDDVDVDVDDDDDDDEANVGTNDDDVDGVVALVDEDIDNSDDDDVCAEEGADDDADADDIDDDVARTVRCAGNGRSCSIVDSRRWIEI